MKLGARIFKTGIAIMLALYASQLLGLPAPVFAGIAAVFAIQPSVYRSYLTALEQIQANVIGAIFSIGFVLLFGNSPFIVGLTAVLVILIARQFKLQNTITVAIVTVIAIMEYQGPSFLNYAFLRFVTIMVGILSASVMNLLFMPPKYETKLYHKITTSTEDILKWIRLDIRQASDFITLKSEISRLKEKMIHMNHFYLLYKEERYYTKKARYAQARKLVMFRQMLRTTNRALETLKYLHRLENELSHMPEHTQTLIRNEVDCLVNYHEQVQLKFIGKTKTHQPLEMLDAVCVGRSELLCSFMKQQHLDNTEEYRTWLHLLPLISSIVNYSEQVERLDRLIGSFYMYHKPSDELQINYNREE